MNRKNRFKFMIVLSLVVTALICAALYTFVSKKNSN